MSIVEAGRDALIECENHNREPSVLVLPGSATAEGFKHFPQVPLMVVNGVEEPFVVARDGLEMVARTATALVVVGVEPDLARMVSSGVVHVYDSEGEREVVE